jgi:peptidyl-prolyl cis-trans isomerase C
MNKLLGCLTIFGIAFFSMAGADDGNSMKVSDGLSEISLDQVNLELMTVPKDIREILIKDPNNLRQFIGNVLHSKRVEAAGRKAGVSDQLEVKAHLMKYERDYIAKKYMEAELDEQKKSMPNFEALANEYYETNKSDYAIPEAVRVSHILFMIDVEDENVDQVSIRKNAEDVLARLKSGEEFSQLAREYSDDKVSAKLGGSLPGWVEPGKTVPAFEKAAFKLQPGEISSLVRSRFGYHIIKVEEKRPGGFKKFEEVRAAILDKLRSTHIDEIRSKLQRKYASRTQVELSREFVSALGGR